MRNDIEHQAVRRVLRETARLLLGAYRFNRIYKLASTKPPSELPCGISVGRLEDLPPASITSPELRDRFGYGGTDSYGYGLFVEGSLAGVCWFWGPQRFHDPLLWSLAQDEAILVDLVTASTYRGRGFAPILISHASAEMRRAGWNSLYTWMWHTHHASYHAFERAGWRQIAWVLEMQLFGMSRPIRFCWQPFRSGTRKNLRHQLTAAE